LPILNGLVVAALVLAAAATFPWALIGANRLYPGDRVQFSLPGMTAELRRVLQPGERIFNSQAAGSWLEFALPRNPVFADSIIEVFPDRIWRQYNDLSTGHQGWQALLSRWDVKAVVLARGQEGRLLPVIRRDPGWRLAYHDKDGYVFLTRSGSGGG
jgi:hypothetical protein